MRRAGRIRYGMSEFGHLHAHAVPLKLVPNEKLSAEIRASCKAEVTHFHGGTRSDDCNGVHPSGGTHRMVCVNFVTKWLLVAVKWSPGWVNCMSGMLSLIHIVERTDDFHLPIWSYFQAICAFRRDFPARIIILEFVANDNDNWT